ncbi:hypothetical protein Pelo_16638 [Pelomyxa schiedti]|nr:hypothetical protein Pelo_16638 [Pelomyxa schiedti]
MCQFCSKLQWRPEMLGDHSYQIGMHSHLLVQLTDENKIALKLQHDVELEYNELGQSAHLQNVVWVTLSHFLPTVSPGDDRMTSKLSLLTCQWQHKFQNLFATPGKNADNNQVPLGATAVRCKDNWQNNIQEVKNDFPGVMGQQYAMLRSVTGIHHRFCVPMIHP